MRPARDAELIQIIDSALADAALRARKQDGSSWLACKRGCTSCCHGVFKISALDAERLQAGLSKLESEIPDRSDALRMRARELVQKLSGEFPGDLSTGLLNEDEEAWERFADLEEADLPCPALDPESGACELYESRPLTCRVFGPPVLGADGIGVCELCYVGADQQTILAGQMSTDYITLEQELDRARPAGETVIAWVLSKTSA